jgi:hypothetical protein
MRISITNDPLLSTFITNQCLNISGNNLLCSSETYSLSNIPLGAMAFNWTVNNVNVANIQGPANGTSVVLNKISNGVVELRCNVTIPTGTLFATKDIGVGTSTFITGYIPSTPKQQNWNDICPAYLTTVIPTITGNPIGTFIWESAGMSSGVSWSQNGNNLSFYFTEENQYAYFRGTLSNACGSYSVLYRFRAVWLSNCSGIPLRVSLNPNPSKGKVRVSLIDKGLKSNSNFIQQIKIIDRNGVIRKTELVAGSKEIYDLDISGIETGVYIIQVFNGRIWIPGKLVVQ